MLSQASSYSRGGVNDKRIRAIHSPEPLKVTDSASEFGNPPN